MNTPTRSSAASTPPPGPEAEKRTRIIQHATQIASSSSLGLALGAIAGAVLAPALGLALLPFAASIGGALLAGAIAELRLQREQSSTHPKA